MPQVYLYSTAGMIKHAATSDKKQFVIATEVETIHKLQKDSPDKEFIPIHPQTICGQMKKVTLQGVLEALENEQYLVKVPDDIREKALLPIERMLEIC
jgi:quinolinate synthase